MLIILFSTATRASFLRVPLSIPSTPTPHTSHDYLPSSSSIKGLSPALQSIPHTISPHSFSPHHLNHLTTMPFFRANTTPDRFLTRFGVPSISTGFPLQSDLFFSNQPLSIQPAASLYSQPHLVSSEYPSYKHWPQALVRAAHFEGLTVGISVIAGCDRGPGPGAEPWLAICSLLSGGPAR